MLNFLAQTNFFTTPFFILSLVSIAILVIMLFSLEHYYKKQRLAVEPEVVNSEIESIAEDVTEEDIDTNKEETVEIVESDLTINLDENEELVEANEDSIAEVETESNDDLVENAGLVEEVVDTVESDLISDLDENDELVEANEEENINVDITNLALNLNDNLKLVEITPEERETVIRYRKSFLAKLIINKDLQDIYKELRDYILHYKKVKSRLSFKYERFSLGRKCLIKMLIRGKRLYLYLALNTEAEEAKYHLVNVSEKKIGKELPALLKVLSPRSVKYAKELIDKLMTLNEIDLLNEDKFVETNYEDLLRKRSLDKLVEDGLIVKYETTDLFFKNSGEYLTEEEIKAITPEEADKLVSDEELERKIIVREANRTGRMEVVNIDDLSNVFNNGDIVDLKSLKEKKLVSKNCERYKVLARGKLDKKFTVEADAFSKQAMKMIVYKGGKVIVYK